MPGIRTSRTSEEVSVGLFERFATFALGDATFLFEALAEGGGVNRMIDQVAEDEEVGVADAAFFVLEGGEFAGQRRD